MKLKADICFVLIVLLTMSFVLAEEKIASVEQNSLSISAPEVTYCYGTTCTIEYTMLNKGDADKKVSVSNYFYSDLVTPLKLEKFGEITETKSVNNPVVCACQEPLVPTENITEPVTETPIEPENTELSNGTTSEPVCYCDNIETYDYTYEAFSEVNSEKDSYELKSKKDNLMTLEKGKEEKFKTTIYQPLGQKTKYDIIAENEDGTTTTLDPWILNDNYYINLTRYINSSGTVTTLIDGGINYTVHTFTSNGTFYVSNNLNVTVLVVAGGGAGGSNQGGGGGAGGLIYNTSYIVSGNIPIIVGTGGVSVAYAQGTNGTNSSFGVLSAKGGGGGSVNGIKTSYSGGSGGGAGGDSEGAGASTGGYGIPGQGDSGGNTTLNSDASGGGGGAGGVGAGDSGTAGGAGGIGATYTINGSSVCYAGGGGGSCIGGGVPGTATCGGGAGGATATSAGNPGTANTGGGGGGQRNANTVGGAGGSGIVIVRYKTSELVLTNTFVQNENLTIKSTYPGVLITYDSSIINQLNDTAFGNNLISGQCYMLIPGQTVLNWTISVNINYSKDMSRVVNYSFNVECSFANDSRGKEAILEGISTSKLGSNNNQYNNKAIYVRLANGSQYQGTFDVFITSGNKRYAFNYKQNETVFEPMFNVSPVFYVWQNYNMSYGSIINSVQTLIDSTN